MKKKVFEKLNILFNECLRVKIDDADKFVIFSDAHLGNGGYQDDFKQNSELFASILQKYYLPRNYTLILNGDIEELYKFRFKKIVTAWQNIFQIFDEFRSRGRLYKIFGNHDYTLSRRNYKGHNIGLMEGIRLEYENNPIFIYHGHQTANRLEDYNRFSSLFGRFILNPIGYKNMTLNADNLSKFKTEKIAYEFASGNKIISILGHTHRPLFESHSKIDSLKFLIENLMLELNGDDGSNQLNLVEKIKMHKKELDILYSQKKEKYRRSGLYNDKILAPCLFNSGSVIGKRGATGIEIRKGKIALVYWFDQNRSSRFMDYDSVRIKRLSKSNFYRAILKKDNLKNIFLRIRLLT